MRLNFLALIKLISLLVFFAIVIYTDLRWRKIPNRITIGFAIEGIILLVFNKGWNGILLGIAAFMFGAVLLLLPFLLGGIGAGDVKMMGTIGVFLVSAGYLIIVWACLVSMVFGGLIAIIASLRKNKLLASVRNAMWELFSLVFGAPALRRFNKNRENNDIDYIPYSLALVLGTLTVVCWLWYM